MVRKFITYTLLFFIPVVLGYVALEYFTRELPSSFKANKTYIEENSTDFEVLLLGSSQMQSAVNPEWMDTPTLNLASGDQHHDTDLKLLKSFVKRLPQLKIIVIEISYSHLEFPKNGKNFWKNSLYLQFYDVNTFERTTYFKDRLVWLSNPSFFSKKIEQLYIDKTREVAYNSYGFNTLNFFGKFKTLEFDREKIDALTRFKINKTPNYELFTQNTEQFFELLRFANENELQVVVATIPMYTTYLPQRNADILRRRDSILQVAAKKFPNTVLFERETDTLKYDVTHFWNHSHLNPEGAKIYTAQLNTLLHSSY